MLLGEIALAAETSPEKLADAAFDALPDNCFGQYDGLIAILTLAVKEDPAAATIRVRRPWSYKRNPELEQQPRGEGVGQRRANLDR